MLIPQPQRDALVDALNGLDPLDVLATVGALQLLPENANALFRLEAAAGVAATLAPSGAGAKITDDAALAWVNRPALGGAADPFNNVFTDELLFHYGSFAVFPGLREEAFYIVRTLARAVLHRRGALPAAFFRPARDLAVTTLMVSDAVARKAGLHRGIDPVLRPNDYAVASDGGHLAELKQAVFFTDDELTRWLNPFTADALAPLVQDLPATSDVELPPMAVLHRPLLRQGERNVVAAPHLLLPALAHALLELAREHDLLETVADRFRDAVYTSVLQSAIYFDWREVDLGLPPLADLRAHESAFLFDRDKLAHVLVVTDDLAGFGGDPFDPWDAQAVAPAVEERLLRAREHLLGLPQRPEDVLQLVILQGLDRPSFFALEEGTERAPRLVLTAADLETIALHDGGGRLLLWKYARARRRFLDRTHAVGGAELDLFHLYVENDDSFYISDDALPHLAMVVPAGVGALRREVQRKRDLHGAPYIVRNSLVEVMLTQQEREIPIYMVMPPPDARRALLVEGYELPLWVFCPEELPDERYGPRYAQAIEALAYWLWQFTSSLREIGERLAERCQQLWLQVELEPDEAWFGGPDAVADARAEDVIRCEAIGACQLRVRLRPAFLALLDRADNEGERELMRHALRALAEVERHGRDGEPLLDEDAIEGAVDAHAPLGQKKVMVLHDTNADPTLDQRGLPSARHIQEDDEAQAMDELGAYLIDELGLPLGRVAPERRTEVLNAAVAFHMRQLEELVATLAPEGLLEWLVRANEGMVSDFNRMRIGTPTKLACYGQVGDIQEQLVQHLPRSSESSIANRFLIEYVAACPPGGTRQMSEALFDRLLALAGQLTSRGYSSDLIHYELEDAPVSMLPSRRLGVGRETAFMRSRNAFLQQFARGEIARSVDSFPRLWRRDAPAEKPDISEYDAALEEELGLTLTEMADLFAALAAAGYERDGEPKVAPASELLDELERELSWPRERVERGFELLALRPRERFAPPGEPYRLEDLYPWRFNRALSFVRRPLVVRPSERGDEVVWGVRQTYVAHQYFGRLVIEGYLKADSAAMRSLIGRLRDEDGEAFNDSVAELYEEDEGLIVRRRVKKIGRLRIERVRGEDLGDIDVLVADRAARRILVVETKDLAIARTPAEMVNELSETFESRGDKPAAIDRHAERVAWVDQHRAEVLEWLGLVDEDPARWTAEGLMVLDIELMSAHLVDTPLPVITYRELRNELAE